MHLVTTWFGSFLVDEGAVVEKRPFPRGPEAPPARLPPAKRKMRKAVGPDDHLHQAVGAMDDLQETENLLLERLREWYGLHFPELARTVDDREVVELIATHGARG